MWNKNIIAALLCSGLMVLAGCQKEDSDVPETTPEEKAELTTYKVTISATKGVDTKALSLDGTTLNAYWKATDKVKVYKAGTYIGELSVVPEDGEKPPIATLSGDLTADGLAANDALTLLIPRGTWDYSGQTGVLTDATGSIESTYDYGLASVNIAAVAGNAVTTSGARFENQQSIYRFGFKLSGTALSVKQFSVIAASNLLVRQRTWNGSDWASTPGSITVISPAATSELLWASLRNEKAGTSTEDTYSFTVIGSDNAAYLGEKAIPATVLDKQGRFISAKSVSVSKVVISKSSQTLAEAW